MSDSQPPAPSASKPKAPVRPRAVTRKTKAEREEYARQEAERAKERAAQEAAAQTSKTPSTRGGRGGRGGARAGGNVGKAERVGTSVGTAGVFGAGSGSRPERGRGNVDVGVSEQMGGVMGGGLDVASLAEGSADGGDGAVGGSSGARSGGGGGGGRGRVKGETDGFYQIEDDDVDRQPRRNIERIWISSDEDEDDVEVRGPKGKQRSTSRKAKPFTGLRPVRAARTMFEEDGDSKKKIESKIGKTVDDGAAVDIDGEAMDVDEPSLPSASAVKKDPPSSPELTKKNVKRDSHSHKIKDPKILSETVEEKAERLRLYEDVARLKDSFLNNVDSSDDTVDSKEDAADAIFGRTDHERMFLLQLPPIVPQLYNPTATQQVNQSSTDGVQVKTEEATVPTADATKDATTESAKQPDTSEPPPTLFTATSPATQRFPPGLVGKLRVHKSGKVTLDWGGTDMEVRYGTEVDFLQNAVGVETPKSQEDTDGVVTFETGNAVDFGQVRRKMVCVPDWERLYA